MMYNNSKEITQRIGWIDISKAIGIFFIVLGHVCKANYRTDPLRLFCYSFNAQLFFLLSGITFLGVIEINSKDFCARSFKDQCFLWFKRLVCPYLIWGVISVVVYWGMGLIGIIRDDYSLFRNFLGLIYGNSNSEYFQWNRPLWFLPCLFCASFIWLLILKLPISIRKDNRNVLKFVTAFTGVFFVVGGVQRYSEEK